MSYKYLFPDGKSGLQEITLQAALKSLSDSTSTVIIFSDKSLTPTSFVKPMLLSDAMTNVQALVKGTPCLYILNNCKIVFEYARP